jgi:hypothetical protein
VRQRGAGLARLERLGQAEVQDLDRLLGRDLDVGRLEVAMDDALLVRRLERRADLDAQPKRLVGGQRADGQAVGQAVALDQFQDERDGGIGLFQAVDAADVRVVERGQEPGFPLEARHPVRVGRKLRWKRLERHVATELAVARPPDLAHAATAEGRDDLVRSDACAGGERHVRRDSI